MTAGHSCQFASLWRILAECMPHLLSFGALSPRTTQIHTDHRERAPTASDGITRKVAGP
jgi:hypothetical protein